MVSAERELIMGVWGLCSQYMTKLLVGVQRGFAKISLTSGGEAFNNRKFVLASVSPKISNTKSADYMAIDLEYTPYS